MRSAEPWFAVTGSLNEAIRSARDLAMREGYDADPAGGRYARTSVAVLAPAEGVYHPARMMYPEGLGDGTDASVSMPIDQVPEVISEESVPFGTQGGRGFDTPDKVVVRFDIPRLKAPVGVDFIAVAPTR